MTTIILLIICMRASGQTSGAIKNKKPRTLTYYYFGDGAFGAYVDTESQYGFKMKWKKCVIKNRHIHHNKRVEKKINERLGDNWLAQNIDKLEMGYQTKTE
jgi:hypothetical protein